MICHCTFNKSTHVPLEIFSTVFYVPGKKVATATADVLSWVSENVTPAGLFDWTVFARDGIQAVVHADNGPQFATETLRHSRGLLRIEASAASLPVHTSHQAMRAKQAVRTIKNLLKKSSDPCLALMAYCCAPWAIGYSPTQPLMGWKICATISFLPAYVQIWKTWKERSKATDKSSNKTTTVTL